MFIVSYSMIYSLKAKHKNINQNFLVRLLFYHVFLAIIYYIYAQLNPSDSIFYYSKVFYNYRGDTWASFYGTSTKFIEFISYPLIKFLGFTYEATMVFFSFLGFIGFLYFYIFFTENIKFKHIYLGYDLMTIIFFLPNLHFWSASFGKGALIFFALGIFFYALSNISKRWPGIVLTGIIIYHVRPHIMLVILISSGIGFVFTNKGISIPVRIAFLGSVAIAFFFIYRDVLSMVGIDEEEFVTQGLDLTHRASELTKATSGVDIVSYSLPMQVFTFLYRPLFIDAPGVLGIIVSFENVFYLLVTLKLLSLNGIRYLVTSNFLVKTALFSFLTVSLALAQVSGNLGLAMRQKSQVMIMFLFVVISFMDKQKMDAYQRRLKEEMRRARLSHLTKAIRP